MTEAPLIIKPFIPLMTKSELFAVMTGGFATIAGSVLAAYINFGVNASHLLSASVMAAPAALGISKLFYPETEESKTQAENIEVGSGGERNALEAAANGASQAIKVCSNIAANLIAFLAFIKFMDALCIWFGSNVDMDFVSFEWILAKLFVPIALLMGVEWDESDKVAKLIGLKTLVNEFVAYKELADLKQMNALSERSTTIATYALCGFSNFASIGITMGALGSLVPSRRSDLAQIALKSMIAGSTVTFISASMAGLLVDDTPVLQITNSTLY
jgi:pyrimidine nucleoside transport protein